MRRDSANVGEIRHLGDLGELVEPALCTTTARLLAASVTSLGALGLGCAMLAAAALLLHPPVAATAAYALLGTLVLAIGERVLALRLHFDAGLFAELARDPAAPRRALHTLDQALQTLRLRAAAAAPRPLLDRVAGARRLVVWHAATVAAQCAGLLLGVVASSGLGLLHPWGGV